VSLRVASIWRHPIKAIGREEVAEVTLAEGQTLPGDRLWAVAHEASKAVDGEWARCMNFLRGASTPALQAVNLKTEGAMLHLSHPARPAIAVNPASDGAALVDWLQPLVGEGRAQPVRLVPAPAGRGMTDTGEASITLASAASHAAVEAAAGQPLSRLRWRCNLWIEGAEAWQEFDWIGRTIRLGEAEAEVYKRIDRCMMTTANPETGERDVPMLDILDGFGHRDFSVGIRITRGGTLRAGDLLEVLP